MAVISPDRSSAARVEAALLGVLLSAETVREGASQLLQALAPALDDIPGAIGVRDRDGLTLHVLADTAGPRAWPALLEPQFALGAQPGVDAATGAYVVPLRHRGRVVGALLLTDPPRAAQVVRAEDTAAAVATAAAVLHTIIARSDMELRRQAAAWRSIDGIADGVAHALTNPLTAASTLVELLADNAGDEGERAALSRVRQELGRASEVVADLASFRHDTHAQDGVLDLVAVVEHVVRFRGYGIRERGITLDVEHNPAYLPVRADIASLEHALHAALEHAQRESVGPVNRRIAVRVVEREGAEVAVHVTDSGVGGAPDLAPAWFDLLTDPLNPARDKTVPDPDLGHAASLLRACGGRLEILASKTEGTTLALVLPRAYTTPASNSARRKTV